MLKKTKRLTKREFDRFFSSGRRHHTPLFTLIYTPHERFHGAAVVPKKVAKKAVERNVLRRRMYAALYNIHTGGVRSGVFIIIAKPPIRAASYTDIRTALAAAIGRAAGSSVE